MIEGINFYTFNLQHTFGILGMSSVIWLWIFQAQIIDIVKVLVRAVTDREPPFGVAHSTQSRAQYGLDVMLKWTTDKYGVWIWLIQPILKFTTDRSGMCVIAKTCVRHFR